MDIRFNGTWSSFDHRWFARLFCMFQVRSVSIVEHRDSLDVFKYSKWNLWSFYFFHIIQSSTMNMKIFEWAPRLRIYIIDFFPRIKWRNIFFLLETLVVAWISLISVVFAFFCCLYFTREAAVPFANESIVDRQTEKTVHVLYK